ncbi:MAG: CbtA family protein [Hyphomicrobiales bacterium]
MIFAAVLAGLAAGLIMSAVQQWRVVPLIEQAEVYENEEAAAPATPAPSPTDNATSGNGVVEPSNATAMAAAGGHDHGGHDRAGHDHKAGGEHSEHANAWAPANGGERLAYTVLMNVLTGIGFAMLLAAASLLLGLPLTPANGLLWGFAGFVVFMLAPSIGLPPQLPGTPVADLADRQLWWWATVAATAAGLGLVLLSPNVLLKALGALLVVMPHLVGAPQPPTLDTAVPAPLAAAYASNALASGVVFWLAIGFFLGLAGSRILPAKATT